MHEVTVSRPGEHEVLTYMAVEIKTKDDHFELLDDDGILVGIIMKQSGLVIGFKQS